MPYEFKFPDVGEGIQEGELVRWLVKEGDAIEADQNIAEVETDKAVVEMPAPKKGIIAKFHHKEGDIIPVGDVFVTIALEGEDPAEVAGGNSSETPAEPAQEAAPAQTEAPAAEPEMVPVEEKQAAGEDGAKYTGSVVGFVEEAQEISPIYGKKDEDAPTAASTKVQATLGVRKLAKEKGVDLASITGTGPDGRITEQDVENAAGGSAPAPAQEAPAQEAQTEPAAVDKPKHVRKYDFYGYLEREPLKGVKKKVAEHMSESMHQAPQVTNFHTADVTALERMRQAKKAEGVKLTPLAYIIKAVSVALQEHPVINSMLEDDEIVMKKYYNVGIAVDTEGGLMVPVVKRANTKNLPEIAEEIKKLSTEARDRKINLMDLKGGSFTISNLGMMGVSHFTPILNYPETALLGVGASKEVLCVLDKNPETKELKLGQRLEMPLSFTYDHRVISGGDAARFMQKVVELLENPEQIE